jgi:hypothetical protein
MCCNIDQARSYPRSLAFCPYMRRFVVKKDQKFLKNNDPIRSGISHDFMKGHTMNEFKFNCPQCDQHIQASEELVGRQFQCPGCNVLIRVPRVPGKEDLSSGRTEHGRTWDTYIAPRNKP